MRSVFRAAAVGWAVVAMVWLTSAPAGAVTASCSDGKVTISLSGVAAIDAANVFCGPRANFAGMRTADFFGKTYTASFKSNGARGDRAVPVADTFTKNEKPGRWALGDLTGTGIESVAVGLRSSSLYAAFLLSSPGGTWQITKNGRVVNTYTHQDIWYRRGDTAVIPLPDTLPLLLGALGGLGVLGWRRRPA